MLSDRPYLRTEYPIQRTSALTWLVCSLIAGFILQLAASAAWSGGGTLVEQRFGVTVAALSEGQLWILLTHGFLHDTHYLVHGLGSLLLIFFVGREILPLLGTRKFIGLFFLANAVGAVAWALLHRQSGGIHLGSMAAANAFLAMFACASPERRLDLLVLFMPVSLRPKHLVWFSLGLALVGLVFFETGAGPQPLARFPISSSAHLGGLFAGWLFHRMMQGNFWRRSRAPAHRALRAEVAGIPAAELDRPATPSDSRAELRAKVDRVLDKINSHGIASLSPEEKRLLDDAKDLLSRH